MNPIRENLADLAEEVSIVDLYDRALRTSRRLAWTRAAVACAAVIVLVVALGATGLALRARPRAQSPIGTPTSAPLTATPPPSSPPPSVVGLPEPAGIDANTLVPWATVPAQTVPGQAFFLVGSDLVELGSGQMRTSHLGADTVSSCPSNTLVVSPDGRWAAFARGDAHNIGREVVLTDLITMAATSIVTTAWCYGHAPIVFAPDSKSVIFYHAEANGTGSTRVGPPVRYDLVSGETTEATDADASGVSAGGFTTTYEGSGLVTRDGTGHVVGQCTPQQPVVLIGQSSDGRMVTVAPRPNDVSNTRNATAMIDTSSCQDWAVPVGTFGPPYDLVLTAVAFSDAGGLFLVLHPQSGTQNRIQLTKPGGRPDAQAPMPAAIASRNPQLLLYLG
jgi:hypothetical protein